MRWAVWRLGVGLLSVVALGGCAANTPILRASEDSLGPSSAATRTAKTILYNLNHGDLRMTALPAPRCITVRSGHVGPLKAPYRICATSTAEGHFVNFVAVGASPEYGISFTDRGPETFLDECYVSLLGDWWEFRFANSSNPATPCPSGWRFHGGP